MINRTITMSIIILSLVACATPQIVEEKLLSDMRLSCSSIEVEIAEADKFEEKAKHEKGFTGTNVVAAIFFWPAMLATYSNANDAIEAANDRKEHLRELYKSKSCSGGTATKPTVSFQYIRDSHLTAFRSM